MAAKAEVLLVGSRRQLEKISLSGVMVGDSLITAVTSARDLGAVFDTNMTVLFQVNAVCQSALYHIKNIGRIRKFLDRDSCERIIHAFVTSRLDLNNALLTGIARRCSHQTAKGPKHRGSGGHSHGREGPHNSGSQGPSLAASALENSI